MAAGSKPRRMYHQMQVTCLVVILNEQWKSWQADVAGVCILRQGFAGFPDTTAHQKVVSD